MKVRFPERRERGTSKLLEGTRLLLKYLKEGITQALQHSRTAETFLDVLGSGP